MPLLKCTMSEKRKTPPSVQGTKMIIKRMQGLDRCKHDYGFYTSLYHQELDSQKYVQFHRTQQHRLDTLVTFHHCPLRTVPIIYHYVLKSVPTLKCFRYKYVLSEPSVWHENWVNPYMQLFSWCGWWSDLSLQENNIYLKLYFRPSDRIKIFSHDFKSKASFVTFILYLNTLVWHTRA